MKPRLVQTRYGLDIEYVENSYSVADIAAMKEIVANDMEAGATAFVTSLRTSFFYDPASTATPDDVEVVKPKYGSSVSGRWIKEHGVASSVQATASVEGVSNSRVSYDLVLPADPTVAPGYAATVGTLGTFGGVTYVKAGAGATDWILAGTTRGTRFVSPLGGGLDDWAGLNAVIAAEMGAGGQKRTIMLLPGTYAAATPCASLPSGTHIVLSKGVRIVSTITPSGGASPVNNVFFATISETATTVALSANTVPGTKTVTVADATGLAVGDWVSCGINLHKLLYQIKDITGAGPHTITFDRPVPCIWTTASTAILKKLTGAPPTGIIIEGNGASISGTGDQALEFAGCWFCRISDLNIDSTNGAFAGAVHTWDTSSRGCIIERVVAEQAPGVYGISQESCEECVTRDCVATGFTLAGINLWDCYGSRIENCRSHDNRKADGTSGTSFWIGSQISGEGCVNCVVDGIQADGAGVNHVVLDRAIGCSLTNVRVNGTTVNGVTVSNATDCTLDGVTIFGTQSALHVSATCSGTRLHDIETLSGNSLIALSYGLQIKSPCQLSKLHLAGLYAFGSLTFEMAAGAKSTVADSDIAVNNYYGAIRIDGTAAYTVSVRDTVFRHVSNGRGIGSDNAAAVVECHNIDTVGFTANDRLLQPEAGKATQFRLSGRVDAPSAGVLYGTPGVFSRGTVALNGATPVTYAFPDIRATDQITATRQAVGGTAAPFIAAISAGVGVVLTGVAGDTSTIAVTIG